MLVHFNMNTNISHFSNIFVNLFLNYITFRIFFFERIVIVFSLKIDDNAINNLPYFQISDVIYNFVVWMYILWFSNFKHKFFCRYIDGNHNKAFFIIKIHITVFCLHVVSNKSLKTRNLFIINDILCCLKWYYQ